MRNHTLFFQTLRKMSQNVSSAAVVIGALRVKPFSKRAYVFRVWVTVSFWDMVLYVYICDGENVYIMYHKTPRRLTK